MEQTAVQIYGDLVNQVLGFGYVLVIIALPIILGILFFQSFTQYKRNKFITEKVNNAILLELTPPREILKSPLAMELFLTSLYQTSGETTFIDTMFKGKTRPWFSLEITSFGGEIKFYLWTFDFWKPIVTSFIYAQYPEINIKEVPDYSKKVHFDPKVNEMFGTQFLLSKPDIYPIKSYNDYNLGDDPKEEFKVDPTTPFFEYLSTVGPGEEIWLQIILRSHKKEKTEPGTWFGKVDWRHAAKEEIKKLKGNDIQEAGEIKISGVSLSKGEKDVIDAIERNVSKLAFDTVIRAIYVAPKDRFNPINIVGLLGSFRQYNTGNLNSFTVDGHHITTFDYPWQDFRDWRANKRKEHILHYYQGRSAYHPPHNSHYFTLNTESIATIYHFPSKTAGTPSINRVEAKKAEPPTNLPI
jgi:hypothetical protein